MLYHDEKSHPFLVYIEGSTLLGYETQQMKTLFLFSLNILDSNRHALPFECVFNPAARFFILRLRRSASDILIVVFLPLWMVVSREDK